jgi:hypothetical protein
MSAKPYPCCGHCPPSHAGGSSLYPCDVKDCTGSNVAARRLSMVFWVGVAVLVFVVGAVVAQVGGAA